MTTIRQFVSTSTFLVLKQYFTHELHFYHSKIKFVSPRRRVYILYTAVSRKVVQQNRTRQCREVSWVMEVRGISLRLKVFQRHRGNITSKSIYAFSFLVGRHREPQSINAKLFLPIIPIGIVAYALTLLWDNLCRNSCILYVRIISPKLD